MSTGTVFGVPATSWLGELVERASAWMRTHRASMGKLLDTAKPAPRRRYRLEGWSPTHHMTSREYRTLTDLAQHGDDASISWREIVRRVNVACGTEPRGIRFLLRHVDDRDVPLRTIRGWSFAERMEVARYAARLHARTSDHPVRVPPLPAVLAPRPYRRAL